MKNLILLVLFSNLLFCSKINSQVISINFDSINSVIENNKPDTSYIRNLFWNLCIQENEKRYDRSRIEEALNSEKVEFKLIYSFRAVVIKKDNNISIDFVQNEIEPIERIFIIANDEVIGHIRFYKNDKYLFTYDGHEEFYQCLIKQDMIYLCNYYFYCTIQDFVLSLSFDNCLEKKGSVSILKLIIDGFNLFPNCDYDGFYTPNDFTR